MQNVEFLAEYYDELYPVNENQKVFFQTLAASSTFSPKYLRIGCGTGIFESQIAKAGFDVTGIEPTTELVKSASIRYKTPTMSVRFFQMSSSEMINFLGKNFYNIVACLDDKILFHATEETMIKFFQDSFTLLQKNGLLVLQLPNFAYYEKQKKIVLPIRQSIRSKIIGNIITDKKNVAYLSLNLEASNGRIYNLLKNEQIYCLTTDKIKKFAKKTGFSSITFYQDYFMNPITADSKTLICVIKK